MKHHDPLAEYDLMKFVAWILETFPPDEPMLPFSDEHQKAEAADREHDARREATLAGD